MRITRPHLGVLGLALLTPVLPEISQSPGVPGGPANYTVRCEGIEVGLESVRSLRVLRDWGNPSLA